MLLLQSLYAFESVAIMDTRSQIRLLEDLDIVQCIVEISIFTDQMEKGVFLILLRITFVSSIELLLIAPFTSLFLV